MGSSLGTMPLYGKNMEIKSIIEIAGIILSSIGISAGIIAFTAKWVANIWAAKIVEREKTKLEKEKTNFTKALNEKIDIYKKAIDIYSELLNNFDYNNITKEQRYNFNKERMRLYGYMGLIAPQEVMSTFDSLTDYLFDVMEQKESYDWVKVRNHSLKIINSIRKDIGINDSDIIYKGKR